jgi:hypothetical protein
MIPPNPESEQPYSFSPAPVAVGGVGGSGTRVIASIMEHLGFHIGGDLNPARDNLAFTLLFKRKELWPLEEHADEIRRSLGIFLNDLYFHQALAEQDIAYIAALATRARYNAPELWLDERARWLLNPRPAPAKPARWGWKEPNTHIFLPALLTHIPNLKYIHVMRHGLDMAHSINQAQMHFWGEALTGESAADIGPEQSFAYWCAAHKRVATIGESMGGNFLLLNFDTFCQEPESGLEALTDFLGTDYDRHTQQELLPLVKRPSSVGRYRSKASIAASQEDLDILRALGFSDEQ